MTDIAAITALLNALVKLYRDIAQAVHAQGVGQEELKVIASLSEVLARGRSLRPDACVRTHDSLVMAAFLRSYAEHYCSDRRYLSTQQRQVEAAVRACSVGLEMHAEDARSELAWIDAMLRGALRTPLYRRLWSAFTAGPTPLLSIVATTKAEFEERFELIYATLASGPAGEALRRTGERWAEQRERIIHRLIALDTHSWFARHVFGNVREHPDFRPMSLRDTYVEPACRWRSSESAGTSNIQDWFREELSSSRVDVLVVSADFGRGKSLSARWLVAACARTYLQGAEPSSETWYPVYARASLDLDSEHADVGQIVARALRRQANDEHGLCLGLSAKDQALRAPTGRVLVVIDGFDEVRLGYDAKVRLFRALREESRRDLRFVVLGRPESFSFLAVEAADRQHVRRAELLDFDDARVRSWLERWNRGVPKEQRVCWEDIAGQSYAELAHTPVLLFMIAFTVGRTDKRRLDTQVELYESFARTMARGKLEGSGDEQAVIRCAARELAAALRDRLQLGPPGSEVDDDVEAMLWLMSRVAWEAHKGDKAIKRRHVESILEEELGLEDNDLEHVLVGGLLAMQADLQSGRPLFFFGHKSLFEFFVARWWWMQLMELSARALDRATCRGIEHSQLGGAPLLTLSNSVMFLRERLQASATMPQGRPLLAWAQGCLNDLAAAQGPPTRAPHYDIQAAAAWIACELSDAFDLTAAGSEEPFRCLLAAMFARAERSGALRLPRLHAPSLTLCHAPFGRADLEDAHFRGADLRGAHLERANLAGANLAFADLRLADLRGAVLRKADLTGANLAGANLARARLEEATLTDARLNGANLRGANLCGAKLARARLRRANLGRADLHDADLTEAELTGADLDEAVGISAEHMAELVSAGARPTLDGARPLEPRSRSLATGVHGLKRAVEPPS